MNDTMNFRPVDIAAFATLQRYTLPSPFRNCDFAAANLCAWQFLYGTEYTVADGFLILRFRVPPHRRLCYMAPVGEGDLARVLDRMADDAAARGEELSLCGVSDEMKARIEALAPGGYRFIDDRDYHDYVYDRTSLATLAGKAMQPKRNHVNRFRRLYPDFAYRPLRATDGKACLALADRWIAERTASQAASSTEAAETWLELRDERRAMAYCFDHFDALQLTGGLLTVGDEIAAFTYGSPINSDTFGVHVEKGDARFEGAYATINQLFAQHLPETYRYINREEDLGVEGLRQAKMSYHPSLLLTKWMMVRKPCIWDDATLQTHLRTLWKEAFGDDDDFLDQYFSAGGFYRRDRVLYTIQSDRLACMLHLLPLTPVGGIEHNARRLVYIYAVATAAEFRRQGLMGLLIDRLEAMLTAEGYDGAVLLPATRQVAAYYARHGFVPAGNLRLAHDENFALLHHPDDAGKELMIFTPHKETLHVPQACTTYRIFRVGK